MPKSLSLSIATSIIGSLLFISAAGAADAPSALPALESGVSTFSARLAADLSVNTTGNIIFSGYNVMNALQLLYPGTTGAGQKEVGEAIGVMNLPMDQFVSGSKALTSEVTIADSSRPGQSKIRTSTSLWANSANQFKFSPQYLTTAKDTFGTQPTTLDFTQKSSLDKINASVSTDTDGMIPKLLSQLSPSTTSVLISTLFVEGEWREKFIVSQTKILPFMNTSSKYSQMPMMNSQQYLQYTESNDYQVVRIPTADNKLLLEVTVPVATGTVQSRSDFMTQRSLPTAPFSTYDVTLQLPRFKVSFQDSIAKEVRNMMPDVFKVGGLDNLGTPQSVVSDVIHSCVLEVQENGFRAAAATAVIAVGAAMPPHYPKAEVLANHSFGARVIRVVNNYPQPTTEVELFRGWVEDPIALDAPAGK